MSSTRRIFSFFCVILYSFAIALIITSLLSDYWLLVKPIEANVKGLNTTFIHMGLFYGQKSRDLTFQSFQEKFIVKNEVASSGMFVYKTCWIFTIFFIALGLFWSFIGLYVSLINTIQQKYENFFGQNGIFLWSLLAIVSNILGIIIYSQFYDIRKSLNVDGLEKMTHWTILGFSYYFIVAATGILFVPMTLILLSKTVLITKSVQPLLIDKTVFLY